MVIDGQRVLVENRPKVIPPTLQLLLEGGRAPDGRLWSPMRVSARNPFRLAGPRAECLMNDHRIAPWLEGFATGSDGVARFLVLFVCGDCGAMCVRDRSFDTLAGLRAGRAPLRRRDHVIGWYAGARPRNRVYM